MDLMNKYRPLTFQDVVGQQFVQNVLKSHLKRGDIKSSYIFHGPYGSGKCVTGDTLVETELGFGTIRSIWEKLVGVGGGTELVDDGGEVINTPIDIGGIGGKTRASYLFCQNVNYIHSLFLQTGIVFSGTFNHPIKIYRDWDFEWKTLGEILPGDIIPVVPLEINFGRGYDPIADGHSVTDVIDVITETCSYVSIAGMSRASAQAVIINFLNKPLPYAYLKQLYVIAQAAGIYTKVIVDTYDPVIGPLYGYLKILSAQKQVIEQYSWNGSYDCFGYLDKVAAASLPLSPAFNMVEELIELLPTSSEQSILRIELEKGPATRALVEKVLRILKQYRPLKANSEYIRIVDNLEWMVKSRMFTTTVISSYHDSYKSAREQKVYDFHVPSDHTYNTSGLISHNTTIARIFARSVLCENRTEDQSPCNQCDSCKTHLEGKNPNVHEINAADNNSIDNIREIAKTAAQKPWGTASKRIFLLDESHDLSQAAQNALLKTLEDPPKTALFLFATTEMEKMLHTVRSRSRMMSISIPKEQEILDRMLWICKKEGIQVEGEKPLRLIVQYSKGHLRDCIKEIATLADVGENLTELLVKRHLNLDLKDKIIQFLLYCVDDQERAIRVAQELLERLSIAELNKKASLILADALGSSLGFNTQEVLDSDDEEGIKKILDRYRGNIVRAMEYLNVRSVKTLDNYEILSDVMVLKRLSENNVRYLDAEVETGSPIKSASDIDIELNDLEEKQVENVAAMYKLHHSGRRRKNVTRDDGDTEEEEINAEEAKKELLQDLFD